jgi:hypothetical protein
MVRKTRECEELAERERQTREDAEQVILSMNFIKIYIIFAQIKQKCRLEVARLEEELRRAEMVNAE